MSDPNAKSLHICLSCAEASGERYAASLVSALRGIDPTIRFSALGGEALRDLGVEIVCDSEGLGIMGFSAAWSALKRLRQARRLLRAHLAGGEVDLFVPIDFPGFNLHLARYARSLDLPVYYIVAPQLWAWGSWRIGGLRRAVSRLVTLLPFERDYFRIRGIDAVHLGHPLLDDYPPDEHEHQQRDRELRLVDAERPLRIGLLPGSRAQEIQALLPEFLAAVAILRRSLKTRSLQTIISSAPGASAQLAELTPTGDIEISDQPLATLLPGLDLAMICSGTASLEASLAGLPHLVAYRASTLNYQLAKRLVRTEHIGLANLILSRNMTREFIQDQVVPAALAADLQSWAESPHRRALYAANVQELRTHLGLGDFWTRTATDLLDFQAHRAVR